MIVRPNKNAASPAIALWLAIVDPWRRVADLGRLCDRRQAAAYHTMKAQLFALLAALTMLNTIGCGKGSPQPAIATKQTAETTQEMARKDMVENSDGPIDDFFKANQGLPIPDALDWVKHNPQSFPGGVTLESMLTGLSNAGAQKINVISNVFDDYHYLIVVTLPTEPLLRQKVFASDSQVREIVHLEKTKDFGQKYLAYPFGSKRPLIGPGPGTN